MSNSITLFGVFLILTMWCWYQSVRCKEMAEKEYNSYKQGMLYRYSRRFFIAAVLVFVIGSLITSFYIVM